MAVAVFTLTACSTAMPGTPLAAPPRGPVGPIPAGLEKFYGQELAWGDCEPYVNDELSKLSFKGDVECARLEVPVDYARPQAATAKLGLLRKRAGKPADRIGALVLNPGGPGQSGMVAAASMDWKSSLAARFDLVGFDPRGVGASEPKVKCLSDKEKDAERLKPPITGVSPEAVAAIEQENKEFAERCAKETGADMLANIGTRDVVKDMDVLRSVLGERKLTYLGFSYGTRIGTAYAEAFPGNVRAMILDGAVAPNQDRVQQIIGQANGFKKAFDSFAAACTKKSTCALGTSAPGAEAELDKMVDPLKATPLAVRDRKLSYSDAAIAVIQGLYSEELWPTLEQALGDFKAGRGDILLKLSDFYQGRNADGSYSSSQDAFTAIRCVDDPPVKDRAVVADEARRIAEGVPKGALDDEEDNAPALSPCAFWAVPNTSAPHEPKVSGLPELLVISSTGDPATPYAAGVELAKALGAALLTVEANSHTAFLQDNRCVDDAGTAYLIDLKPPAEGTRCK
ncbi:alpha/beta fold hydrolase [Kibdelosporangium banguiense]|nr:alpha/beta fold hydrolase [Kibdelosporangium banguiense]